MSSTIINPYIAMWIDWNLKILLHNMYPIENLEEMLFRSEHSLVYCIRLWSLWYIEILCDMSCCHLLEMGFMAITLNYISWKSFIKHVYFLQRWMQLYCVVNSSKFIFYEHIMWIEFQTWKIIIIKTMSPQFYSLLSFYLIHTSIHYN